MAEVVDFQQERGPEPLWREELGRTLRAIREDRGDRLVDVAERAGVSPQYLSEVERGRKEPSSEMIAAITGALEVELSDLLISIAGDVRRSGPLTRSAGSATLFAGPTTPSAGPLTLSAGPVLLAA
ncbi:XRE family transcriptional regulator [Saccharopolyspora rhizosphaerae]|uniref:XRE family transcriptional regulator n=1 Tax=Saccharopolyspora rhizosphaerae TaxID=2492662 RepID=A0A3R8Q6W6_9PSEU|nr:helix-turn-helix transcriptional regulator [Saccharopolyspora rhizosphaerae]RRO14453.1 XRE family transcriptional regulator [Saccharopolyspora rhizosphaerae]